MRLKPHWFDFGRKSPDGGRIEFGGMEWDENPKYLIPPDIFATYDLWYSALDYPAWRDGSNGPASMKWLPDPGGLNDQCSVLMDAFEVVSVTARQVANDTRTQAGN